MSLFGWSYPPGCNGPPDDEWSEDCQVCGARNEDQCVCRVCPSCGCVGDPDCYVDPIGRKRFCDAQLHPTAEQLRRRAKREAWENEQAEKYGAELPEIDFTEF